MTRLCWGCSKRIEGGRADRRWCSDRCRMADRREERRLNEYGDYHKRRCAHCDCNLHLTHLPNMVYCSDRCRQAAHRARKAERPP